MDLQFSPLHPLLITHILEKILKYHSSSNPPSFLHLRLVCHQWNLISSKLFLTQSIKVITFGSTYNPISSLTNLIQLIENSSKLRTNFPLVHYHFLLTDLNLLASNSLQSLKNLSQFLTKCPSTIHSLIIEIDQSNSFKIPPQNYHLPFLKLLVYSDCRAKDVFDVLNCLLKSSPNLKSFTLKRKEILIATSSFSQPQLEVEVSERLKLILEESLGNLISLKELILDLKLSEELLLALRDNLTQNQLKKLSFCLKTSVFSTESFYTLLESQKSSLTNLKLGGLCKKSRLLLKFPTLVNLEELELQGWCQLVELVKIDFNSYSLGELFPNLQCLRLNTWSENGNFNKFLEICGNSKNSHLKRLKLPEEIRNFGNIENFQNLKTLELHFNHNYELFEIIFKIEQLEQLKILRSFREFRESHINIDSLLTGLSKDECCRMNRINNYAYVSKTNGASLRNLKNLIKLDLTDVLYQTEITDVTGYFVLMLMPKLTSFKIRRSKLRLNCLLKLEERFSEDMEEIKFLMEDSHSNSYCLIA